MFVVLVDVLGIEILCNVVIVGDIDVEDGYYVYICYNWVCVLFDYMFGKLGEGFKVVQVCFGGGCIYYVMCIVGICNCVLEMMLECVVLCCMCGKMLGDYQFVQVKIVDLVIEFEQFCLLVFKIVWIIDEVEVGCMLYGVVCNWIGMCKIGLVKLYYDVVGCSLELYGLLGILFDMLFVNWFGGYWLFVFVDGLIDVYKFQFVCLFMKKVKLVEGFFLSEYIFICKVVVYVCYFNV